MLHLNRDAKSYVYLNKTGCSTLAAVDDREQFNTTVVSSLNTDLVINEIHLEGGATTA